MSLARPVQDSLEVNDMKSAIFPHDCSVVLKYIRTHFSPTQDYQGYWGHRINLFINLWFIVHLYSTLHSHSCAGKFCITFWRSWEVIRVVYVWHLQCGHWLICKLNTQNYSKFRLSVALLFSIQSAWWLD